MSELKYDSLEKLGQSRKRCEPNMAIIPKNELSLSNEFVTSYVSKRHCVGEHSCQNEALFGKKAKIELHFFLKAKNISTKKSIFDTTA